MVPPQFLLGFTLTTKELMSLPTLPESLGAVGEVSCEPEKVGFKGAAYSEYVK